MSLDPDDIASQKLDEIRERVSSDFSREEIETFIKSGKILASKSVLSALISLIEEGPERGLDASESKRLAKKVRGVMPYNYCGYCSMSFHEMPYVLNISLTLAKNDYKTTIEVPSDEYAQQLYGYYNFLKNIAQAFWKQWQQDHPEVYKRVSEYLAKPPMSVDISELKIDDEISTSLVWDKTSRQRVSLICYWTLNGTVLTKKQP
jgi:hypothetical protein